MIQSGKILWMAIALLWCMELPAGESAARRQDKQVPDVVYVGTPYDVVSAMLKLAHIRKDDLVVVIATAHALKFSGSAAAYHEGKNRFSNPPRRLPATLAAVLSALDR